jgi:hypothetical protein
MCVLDIPAKPVAAPRRGHELHRALRSGGARAAQLAELRLDEVHGCEHVPRDLEPVLRLTVVTQQFWCRSRVRHLDGVDADGRRQPIQLPLGSEKVSAHLLQVSRNERKRVCCEARVTREQSVDALLVQRQQDDGLRRGSALWIPVPDRLIEVRRGLNKCAGQGRGLFRDGRVDARRRGRRISHDQ